jgi:hypothetical protein
VIINSGGNHLLDVGHRIAWRLDGFRT